MEFKFNDQIWIIRPMFEMGDDYDGLVFMNHETCECVCNPMTFQKVKQSGPPLKAIRASLKRNGVKHG